MLTEFGKILRKIRIDHGEVLKSMADKLKISSSYLSAMEVGKRPASDAIIQQIVALYSLDNELAATLKQAADKNTLSVRLNLSETSSTKRNAALVFARNFDEMDKATAEQILKLFAANKEEDH